MNSGQFKDLPVTCVLLALWYHPGFLYKRLKVPITLLITNIFVIKLNEFIGNI